MLSLGRLPVALAILAGALLAGAPSNAQSRDWPTRPVRFILPLGPGSGADITARMLADRLMARWGQPVIVENKPGGDAVLAITTVLNAHDDHVLLYSPTSSFTAHPLLHDKVPYNVKDLEPIARTTTTLIGFGVPASLGVSSVKDFVAKVRAAPGTLNYASATGANDLMFASFLKIEKLDMSKVPYRDPVQPINDLAEGRVHAYVGAYAILRPQIEAGKIKMLALTNPNPAPSMPNMPTVTQGGLQGPDDRRSRRAVWAAWHAAGAAPAHCRGRARCSFRQDHRGAPDGTRAGRQSRRSRRSRQGARGSATGRG
jgi:tripartite-type tricarboxylate transporter receptor subunit TctC